MKKFSLFQRFIKRSFDVVASLLGFLILLPLLLIIFLILLITNRGKALFIDERIGRNEKKIGVLKFRTMYYDAESNIHKYLTQEQLDKWEIERKLDSDPRITKIGKILRKTSVDELPQLLNILFGDLSIIGPRPITEKELDQHFNNEDRKKYLSVRPGLISVWGVSGRNEITFESGERQKIELSYFDNLSLRQDTKIFFSAIPAVIKGRGAK